MNLQKTLTEKKELQRALITFTGSSEAVNYEWLHKGDEAYYNNLLSDLSALNTLIEVTAATRRSIANRTLIYGSEASNGVKGSGERIIRVCSIQTIATTQITEFNN